MGQSRLRIKNARLGGNRSSVAAYGGGSQAVARIRFTASVKEILRRRRDKNAAQVDRLTIVGTLARVEVGRCSKHRPLEARAQTTGAWYFWSVGVFRSQQEGARRAVGAGRPYQPAVILLVENIVGVERQRQVRRHRIARHQIEQHQRILLEVFAVGARLLGVDLALPAQVAADAQRRPLPRQLVAGEELERILRDLRQQALAVGIFRLGARIAAADLPARQHLAGDFELEAFRYGAAFGAVRRLAIRIQWRVGNRHGEIILLYPKNRGAGIELAVVEFA